MINEFIRHSRISHSGHSVWNKSNLINGLIESRNLFNTETIQYGLASACCMDLDANGNFLLVGLSNGSVDLQGVQDSTSGSLDHIASLTFSRHNIHRIQWNPGDEQFFSMLDHNNLYLVDPVEMRVLDRFDFCIDTNWSAWNPNDRKMIAVSGSKSQVRLVDIQSGSSIQTIILGAPSGLPTHQATRCLWSSQDYNCLIVGDDEGYLHVYDTRHTTRPYILTGEERGRISGMSFTEGQQSIITAQHPDNRLVQWHYDKCTLRANLKKFKKREKVQSKPEDVVGETDSKQSAASTSSKSHKPGERKVKKRRSRPPPISYGSYGRCQLYVTDRHVYCPVPARAKNSKELYIYDLVTGYRVKTLKSESIMCQGVYSVVGLLPDSLVLYVGGQNRVRVWGIDEDYQRKVEERMQRYHTTNWDSDDHLSS